MCQKSNSLCLKLSVQYFLIPFNRKPSPLSFASIFPVTLPCEWGVVQSLVGAARLISSQSSRPSSTASCEAVWKSYKGLLESKNTTDGKTLDFCWFLLYMLILSPLTFPFKTAAGYRTQNVIKVHLLSLQSPIALFSLPATALETFIM